MFLAFDIIKNKTKPFWSWLIRLVKNTRRMVEYIERTKEREVTDHLWLIETSSAFVICYLL